jgi:hypothetical protein
MSAILGEIPSIGRRPLPLDQLAATLDRGGHASPEQGVGVKEKGRGHQEGNGASRASSSSGDRGASSASMGGSCS